MRILSGIYKGRQLDTPEGDEVRPPLELVREAVFNILGEKAKGATVLDLFAGSGSLGIEALSRGAAACVFVEAERKVAAYLKRNLAQIGAEAQATLLIGRLPEVLARPEIAGRSFDLIFADPPFDLIMRGSFLDLDARLGPLLEPQGLLILRLPEGAPRLTRAPLLEIADERKFGISVLRMLRRPVG